jgi:HSP20 family protein
MASRIQAHLLLGPISTFSTRTPFETTQWQPPVDIYELDDRLLIQVEVPGLQMDDLELHFERGELRVEGVRLRPPLPAPMRAARVEMIYGAFSRLIPLPDDARGDDIRASYDAGILQILVPRRANTPERRRIEIS